MMGLTRLLLILVGLADVLLALRFDVEDRLKRCILEPVHAAQTLRGSYSVLPRGREIVVEVREAETGRLLYSSTGGDELFELTAKVDGRLEFCFQNVTERTHTKVDFELVLDEQSDHLASLGDRIAASTVLSLKLYQKLESSLSRVQSFAHSFNRRRLGKQIPVKHYVSKPWIRTHKYDAEL
ncbi:hypothetical protein NDN08_007276 [Rhodosorus marinus]|uniref:GOLD domain-containing protein n=1 Tax=Rhodosorus marinus TaxID=101924 RepID=A0AAV8UG12_9RHOD|nr:hypothetical protein NDN08_007276 [Rhodosorus marinus]